MTTDFQPTILEIQCQSGGGPPHSATLARGTGRPANAQRPGVRQPSGALPKAELRAVPGKTR
jgi:hypothetical protein